jgi:hypothetical protein
MTWDPVLMSHLQLAATYAVGIGSYVGLAIFIWRHLRRQERADEQRAAAVERRRQSDDDLQQRIISLRRRRLT